MNSEGSSTSDRECTLCPSGETSTAVNSAACQRIRVTQVVTGDSHTCVLLSDASVKCWGRNDHGRLGYGNTERIGDDELPSAVGAVSITNKPGVRVTELAAGFDHTCALLSDGTLKCWGLGRWGALGYGSTQDVGNDELPSSVGPVSVTNSPGVTVEQIAAGVEYTCALLSDDSVKCWGGNFEGELGQGNTVRIGDDELPSSVAPVSVVTAPGVRVKEIIAGVFETCAILSDASVINPALKGRGFVRKSDVEHATVSSLSRFAGRPTPKPPRAEPSDSHGFSRLSQH